MRRIPSGGLMRRPRSIDFAIFGRRSRSVADKRDQPAKGSNTVVASASQPPAKQCTLFGQHVSHSEQIIYKVMSHIEHYGE